MLILTSIQVVLTALVLFCSVLLGGGQGGLGDTLVQLLAFGLLAVLIAAELAGLPRLSRCPRRAWIMIGLVLIVPMLHLLPPHLPAQPTNAERAIWFLTPAIAVFLSTLAMTPRMQRWMVAIVVLMALLSAGLGVMQLAGGSESPLRLYENTNATEAVGFFANRNHLAALLAMCLPFCIAAVIAPLASGDTAGGRTLLRVILGLCATLLIVAAVILTHSRAGVLLIAVCMVLALPMVWPGLRRLVFKRSHLVLALALVAVATGMVVNRLNVFDRLSAAQLAEDHRWQIAQVLATEGPPQTLRGTGLGTFAQVFQAADAAAPGRYIVKHAHNDYLELWVEAGWILLIVGLGLVVLLARQAVSVWREPPSAEALWPRAASLAVAMMLLHSALDYPLRTTTNIAVFALALAIFWYRPSTSKGIE